jgi:hypothetical protein
MRNPTGRRLESGVLALLTCAGVVACSSSDEDAGKPSGGDGIFGVFASLKAAGGATMCVNEVGDDPCTVCAKTSCCGPFRGCANDTSCMDLVECATTCKSDGCVETCINSNTRGTSAILPLVTCGKTSCSTQCELTAASAN